MSAHITIAIDGEPAEVVKVIQSLAPTPSRQPTAAAVAKAQPTAAHELNATAAEQTEPGPHARFQNRYPSLYPQAGPPPAQTTWTYQLTKDFEEILNPPPREFIRYLVDCPNGATSEEVQHHLGYSVRQQAGIAAGASRQLAAFNRAQPSPHDLPMIFAKDRIRMVYRLQPDFARYYRDIVDVGPLSQNYDD